MLSLYARLFLPVDARLCLPESSGPWKYLARAARSKIFARVRALAVKSRCKASSSWESRLSFAVDSYMACPLASILKVKWSGCDPGKSRLKLTVGSELSVVRGSFACARKPRWGEARANIRNARLRRIHTAGLPKSFLRVGAFSSSWRDLIEWHAVVRAWPKCADGRSRSPRRRQHRPVRGFPPGSRAA